MTEIVHGPTLSVASDPILPRWWRTVDKTTMAAIFLLFGIGMVLSLASSPPLAKQNGLPLFHYAERQAIFGVMALIAMVGTSMLPLKMIRRLAILGFIGALIALMLLPLLGTDFGKGAVRWYSLGFASVQPSEFLKPVFIVVAAWLLAASGQVNAPPGRLLSLALALLIAGFLVMQPDYGQTAIVMFGWGVMYFAAGAPILPLVIMAGLSIFAGTIAYQSSEHFARRIDGFLAADVDPTTQLGYAANAIREGGFFGVGVGEGQVKWSLPDAHTDFIIAVAAEEFGLILVLLILALYALIVLRSLRRLMDERDLFFRLAGTGLVASFGVQAMINMGVAVRLLPAKGMTLPFVSYGGSSLIAGGVAVGMILAFSRTRPQDRLSPILQRQR